MKRTAVVALCLSSLAASAATPAPVTLMVDDVPVTQVLQALAGQEKHNLVISPDVSGTLSLHLVDVPWKQALNTVIASAGLTLRREGNILYVHSASWQQQQYDAREAALEKQKQSLPLEERSLTLRYAQASELAKAGEKLLGPKGTITVDNRLNRLLLRDHKASLNVLEKWVAQMDLPVEQVELAAHIVTINEKSLRELGVKWGLGRRQSPENAGRYHRFQAICRLKVPAPGSVLISAVLTGGCWILSYPHWNKNSNWRSSPAHDYWPLTCSLPALNKAVKSLTRSPAAKAAQRRWNLKKRCWVWR
jgi:protein transport protein HofQ